MRQVIHAVNFANVVANLRDRALVAGIVARTLHHLKPALGRVLGKLWQTTPQTMPITQEERMLMGNQLRLVPIYSTVSLRGSRS